MRRLVDRADGWWGRANSWSQLGAQQVRSARLSVLVMALVGARVHGIAEGTAVVRAGVRG